MSTFAKTCNGQISPADAELIVASFPILRREQRIDYLAIQIHQYAVNIATNLVDKGQASELLDQLLTEANHV